MRDPKQLPVDVHVVPLPSDEAEERQRRLGALLLKGASRLLQQQDEQRDVGEAEPPARLDPVRR